MTTPLRFSPAARAMWDQGRLGSLRAAIATAEDVAITGQRVRKPSDRPDVYPQIQRLRSESTLQAAFVENAGAATTLLDTADSALGVATDQINTVRERVIQLSNTIYDASTRASAAREVNTIRDQLIALANTSVGERRLFAGEKWDADPYSSGGLYAGGNQQTTVEVGRGLTVATAWDGSKVFQGTVDIFQVLADVANALSTNNVPAATATLADLDTARQQLVSSRADIGIHGATALDAGQVARELGDRSAAATANLAEEDQATAFTKLAQLRSTYEAAMQTVVSRPHSLFELLR